MSDLKLLVIFFILMVVSALPTQAQQLESESQGLGLPVSLQASVDVKKQEAFVAAILDGLGNMVETRYWQQIQTTARQQKPGTFNWEQDKIFLSTHEMIGELEVESHSVLKGYKQIVDNLVECVYQNQKIIVKNKKLVFPSIQFLQFPNWKTTPQAIGGVRLKQVDWHWDKMIQQWWCMVKLAYRFQNK